MPEDLLKSPVCPRTVCLLRRHGQDVDKPGTYGENGDIWLIEASAPSSLSTVHTDHDAGSVVTCRPEASSERHSYGITRGGSGAPLCEPELYPRRRPLREVRVVVVVVVVVTLHDCVVHV